MSDCLEHVDQREGGLRGTHVDLVAVFNLLSTGAALELVVVNVGSAKTDGGFDVPVTREDPLVAIADAATDVPALEAMVAQIFPVAEGKLYVGCVILATKCMDANERTIEAMAEPIAVLGIQEPMLGILPILAVTELPGVKTIKKLN